MRASEKAKIRQRRIAHTLLVVFSFSLMFLGKADFSALRHARMGASDFIAPFVDLVSAPIRGSRQWHRVYEQSRRFGLRMCGFRPRTRC